MIKRIYILLCATICLLTVKAQTNLLKDGGFEDYSCNAFGCSWYEWTMPLGLCSADTTDKIDGNASLRSSGALTGTIDQPVELSDEAYPVRRIFQITLNYKVLSMPAGESLKADCYWEPIPGGDGEKMKKHDADQLQRDLPSEVSERWEQVILETSKPANSSRLRIRVKMPKKSQILLDAFSVVETDRTAEEDTTHIGPQEEDTTAIWTQNFVWDMSAPLTYMKEGFDRGMHNQPLAVKGWQNVAKADGRPWWGFESWRTGFFDEEFKCAKVSSYQNGKDSTDTWEMWLVTPALDYKNAASQVFTFSVMGEFMPESGNNALFEVYFIDARDTANVFFQIIEGLAIPTISEQNRVWVPFEIHLEDQKRIPDIFFMAFRYVCENGAKGVVTYYVDDVSWGEDVAQEMETVTGYGLQVTVRKVLRDGQIIILRDGKAFNVLGVRL